MRLGQLARPSDTLLIAETLWPNADVHAGWMWLPHVCGVFSHSAGKVGNFIFFDGPVKSRKWHATLYPLAANNWELSPGPNPSNLKMRGPAGCQWDVPAPGAKEYQAAPCLPYQ